jgi:hypothetical protein
MRPSEDRNLRLESISHRMVGIEFSKGSGDLRVPINAIGNWELSIHAQLIERVGDVNMNLRWSFCGSSRQLKGDL